MLNRVASVSGVIGPQHPLPGLEHLPEMVLRRGMVALRRHFPGDGEPGGQRVLVIQAQRPLPGREHRPQRDRSPGVVAARRHRLGHGEPGGQRVRVIRPQGLLPGREHLAELVLRRGALPARRHLLGDAEPGGQRVRVIRAQRPLLIGQDLPVERDGVARTPLVAGGRRRTRTICQRVGVIQPQPVPLIHQGPLVQLDGHVGVVRLEPERQAQRVGELPAAGKTIVGSLRQGAQQDVIHGRREAGPPRRQRGRRCGQVRVHHRHDFIPGKGRLAGQQRVHRARQCVLIRARIDLVTPDLLGRAVVRRPQDVAGSGLADQRQRAFRQPEIG
jgi:hypothetical protein